MKVGERVKLLNAQRSDNVASLAMPGLIDKNHILKSWMLLYQRAWATPRGL